METGVQDWNMSCGVCHVGGGQMEYDRDMKAYDPAKFAAGSSENSYYSFDRGQIVAGFMSSTNKAEVDCLMCHLNNSATGANQSGAGRAWLQSVLNLEDNTIGCNASHPWGPLNDPYCQQTGLDPNFGLPTAGPYSAGTAYDPFNRNLAIKALSFEYAASLGIGAKVTSYGNWIAGPDRNTPGVDRTYKYITGITGVPSTISGANIQGTPPSQNCSACHARDDNTPGAPGMLSTVRLGYGNVYSRMPPGSNTDLDTGGTNSIRWIELGCKTGMGKRGQRIGEGPNDKWGMSMFNAMFGLGVNPGTPVTTATYTVTGMMAQMGFSTVSTKERIPDYDVHDKAGMQCATCHYAIGGRNITGVATNEAGFILASNGTVTIPAAGNVHGLNTAGGENTLSFGVNYPEETIYGIDHQFAQGDDLKDTYGKNNLDGTVSCEACHIDRTHPKYFSRPNVAKAGVTPPPVPTHASFPALHMDKIACTTCHIPEVYIAPFRLKSRDWTLGWVKKGNETNGAFKNIYDWSYDFVTGAHQPIKPLHQWATKYEKKKIVPVTPSEMPIWVKLNSGNTDATVGNSDGQTPDTNIGKTCTYGSRIFATCSTDADCPGGLCVSGVTSYAAPAKTKDVMAAAQAVDAAGLLRRPAHQGNINSGNIVPLFDGWPLTDAQSIDTAARMEAMAAAGAGDLLKIFHAPFDLTHGIVPKEWALGGSKRGGCISCHSSEQPYAYDSNGSITGPNPNYSEYSVGFFEGDQHDKPKAMAVANYDLLKNQFNLFADFDCTNIVNGLCMSYNMDPTHTDVSSCVQMCEGMMGYPASACDPAVSAPNPAFCSYAYMSGTCNAGTGPNGTYTDEQLFGADGQHPNLTNTGNPFLGACVGFMQSNFDPAMGWPQGTAQAMGMLDGISGLQGFVLRETIDGTSDGCNPIIGTKNVATAIMGAQAVGMMGNLNSCMPSGPGFDGVCSGATPATNMVGVCSGGFAAGKTCMQYDMQGNPFADPDADCKGTLPSAEASHNPYGLLLSRPELRARFAMNLQQGQHLGFESVVGPDGANRLWWPILTEQNPGNPNHKWGWDMAGAPDVCGAFQNEPCCTDPMTMRPTACANGKNVRTTIHANQLLGYTQAVYTEITKPALAGASYGSQSNLNCTACHTMATTNHNTVPSCQTCHLAGAPAMQVHVGATINVQTACDQCHGGSSGTTTHNGADYKTAFELASVGPNMHGFAPTARFSWRADAAQDYNVLYDASASTCPSGATCAYSWAFGDGASGSGVTTSYVYSDATTRTVTLTVSNGPAIASYSLSVIPQFVGSNKVVVSPPVLSQSGTSLTLTDVSTGGTGTITAKVSWGDGSTTTLTGHNQTFGPHTYSQTTTYNGSIYVADSGVNGLYKTSDTKPFSVTFAPMSISGLVTKNTGPVLSGVTLTLKLGGVAKKLSTSATNGRYTFSNVAPGTYDITATKTGFTFTTPYAVTGISAATTSANIQAIP